MGGWTLVCGQSAKENPAADCNLKLSFQRHWRWYHCYELGNSVEEKNDDQLCVDT
jgi:hypothetical protein